MYTIAQQKHCSIGAYTVKRSIENILAILLVTPQIFVQKLQNIYEPVAVIFVSSKKLLLVNFKSSFMSKRARKGQSYIPKGRAH